MRQIKAALKTEIAEKEPAYSAPSAALQGIILVNFISYEWFKVFRFGGEHSEPAQEEAKETAVIIRLYSVSYLHQGGST
jgi:hypothetical protein